MEKDFTAIYCFVDDFIKSLASNFSTITSRKSKPGISNYLSISEVLTIIIGYYDSCCKLLSTSNHALSYNRL